MNVIAVIPARGGSRRIPLKNIKDFHGKPIIAYSIEKAQQSGLFNRIVVSTDDDRIASVAARYGAEVWHRHPLCGADEIGTQAVMQECLEGLSYCTFSDFACCIYATSPLMDIQDLVAGYNALKRAGFDTFAMSVGYPPLQDAGQFYWGTAYAFREGLPLISENTILIPIEEERVCDINTMFDWTKALVMYEELQK